MPQPEPQPEPERTRDGHLVSREFESDEELLEAIRGEVFPQVAADRLVLMIPEADPAADECSSLHLMHFDELRGGGDWVERASAHPTTAGPLSQLAEDELFQMLAERRARLWTNLVTSAQPAALRLRSVVARQRAAIAQLPRPADAGDGEPGFGVKILRSGEE